MHEKLPFLLALIAAIVFIEMLAKKLQIAYPVLLVIAGLLISLIPSLPKVQIDPNMIFFIFLPPLLFGASWSISFKEMKKWWRIIGSFAFLVVLFSALAVAVVANYYIPGFTIALGFLLGGIVSPPDAVSTGAITQFVKIPKSTAAILEGESLLNDASSLIIFRFALVAVGTGQFIFQTAIIQFSWMVIGGVGIGLLFGWLFMQMHKRLPTDASSDIIFTILEPYFLYWIAEQIHSSGVLAVVACGLFLSNRNLTFLSSSSRIRGFSVWEAFTYVLNGIVFMIIGLALPEAVAGLKANGIPLKEAMLYGVIITAVLILARMISSYIAMGATILFRPKVAPGRGNKRRMLAMPLLMGWTGMRGVVSLAAALAIPTTLRGAPFPHRNLILFVTFMVILLTLLIQGLTLPYFIKRVNIQSHVNELPEEEAKLRVKRLLVAETVHLLKEMQLKEELKDNHHLKRMVEQWEHKLNQPEHLKMDEPTKEAYLELLERQRLFLIELNYRDPEVHDEIVRWQAFQIDLEEERIRLL